MSETKADEKTAGDQKGQEKKASTESLAMYTSAKDISAVDKAIFFHTRAVWCCNICLRNVTSPVSFQCEDPLHIFCKACVDTLELKKCTREKCQGALPCLPCEDPQDDLPWLIQTIEEQEKKAKAAARADWKEHQFNVDEVVERTAPKLKLLKGVQDELNNELKKQKDDEKTKAESDALDREAAQLEREEKALADRKAALNIESERERLLAAVSPAERKVKELEQQKQFGERQGAVRERWQLVHEYGLLEIEEKRLLALRASLEAKQAEFASRRNKQKQLELAPKLLAVENARVELAAVIDTKHRGLVELINAREKGFQLAELILPALTFNDLDLICTRLMLNTCAIQSLILDDSGLEDSHVRMIARAIGDGPSACPQLHTVSLRGNLFGEVGAMALLEAVSRSPYTLPEKFSHLLLDDNYKHLSNENRDLIEDTMRMNNSVRKVFPKPAWDHPNFVSMFEHLIVCRQHSLIKIDLALGIVEE